MEEKIIFVCEDSFDGILAAIYDAWCEKLRLSENGMDRIGIIAGDIGNYRLFTKYVTVATDNDKSAKVARSIRNKISAEAFESVYHVSLSHQADKCDTIFGFLMKGFKIGGTVMEHIADPYVMRMLELSRNVGNEAHHFLGFVRFEELGGGMLFSKICPKNHVITIIADHFNDRLSNENFIIYDENRKVAAVHRKNEEFFIVSGYEPDFLENKGDIMKKSVYEDLWKVFFETIEIKSRRNKKLQRNNLPYRFRSNLTEFN